MAFLYAWRKVSLVDGPQERNAASRRAEASCRRVIGGCAPTVGAKTHWPVARPAGPIHHQRRAAGPLGLVTSGHTASPVSHRDSTRRLAPLVPASIEAGQRTFGRFQAWSLVNRWLRVRVPSPAQRRSGSHVRVGGARSAGDEASRPPSAAPALPITRNQATSTETRAVRAPSTDVRLGSAVFAPGRSLVTAKCGEPSTSLVLSCLRDWTFAHETQRCLQSTPR